MKNNSFDTKPPKLISVEASAGTGKTTNLASRYIKLLFSGQSPENIVAITFTNKATNEMKGRIIEYLKKRVLEIYLPEEELKNLDSNKCKEILEELIFKFHNFRITTIDSFLTLLGRNFSFDLKFPPAFDITLSEENFLNNALKEYLENIKPDSKEEKEILDYFKKILYIKEDLKWNFFEIISDDINKLFKIEKKTGKEISLPKRMEIIGEMEEEIRKKVESFGVDKFARNEVKEFVKKERNLFDFKLNPKKDYIEQYDKSTIPKKYKEYLLQYPIYLKFPTQGSYKKIKEFLEQFIENEGTFTLDFLIKKLKDMIKNFKFPNKYIYIAEKINHILIDEFQDTSPLQWNVLEPLIENSLSEGGTFYYVGDRKQAIYGFRGGDYRIFDIAKNIECAKDKISEVHLYDNYRSRKEILDFVKDVFDEKNIEKAFEDAKLNEITAEINKHFSKIKDSQTRFEEKGYVEVISFKKGEEKEGEGEKESTDEVREKIMDLLPELIKNKIMKYYEPKDIAILVRTNKQARDILLKLLENDIPAISPSALGLFSSDTIREIICLLKFLCKPEDELVLAQVLLSDIFIQNTDKKREEFEEYIFNLKKNGKNYLLINFKKDFSDLYKNYFKEILDLSAVLTPYEITTKIYRKFNILKNFPEEEGFFYAFLEYLSSLQDRGIVTLKETIKEIEEIPESEPKVLFPIKTPQIKVMTIHKAKGLGSRVVIVPYLCIYTREQDHSYYKEEGEMVIPYHLNSDISKKAGLEEIYNETRTKYFIEELNALYVALTRAKEALFVIVPNFQRDYLYLTKNLEKEIYGELPKEKSAQEGKKEKADVKALPDGNWAEKVSRDFVDLGIYRNIERYEKIQKGIEMHKKIQSGDLKDIPKKFLKIINPENFIKRDFEKEIVDEEGNIYRTDMLIHFKDNLWVIDFKFGEKRKEDIEQIKNYIKLIKEIEKKSVEGFLLYFEKEEVIEIND